MRKLGFETNFKISACRNRACIRKISENVTELPKMQHSFQVHIFCTPSIIQGILCHVLIFQALQIPVQQSAKIYLYQLFIYEGGLVAQAVRRSPPTAGVQSLRLGPSMWVSWWTKRGLGRFFSGFLPFSPTTHVIPPFLHTHLIHFVSFHLPL